MTSNSELSLDDANRRDPFGVTADHRDIRGREVQVGDLVRELVGGEGSDSLGQDESQPRGVQLSEP